MSILPKIARPCTAGDAERSKEEKLKAAKATYESALKRASTPDARAEAKEDYESVVRSIG